MKNEKQTDVQVSPTLLVNSSKKVSIERLR